ncbi:hypothetical protein J7T55_014738 [Diaporthe amygdali]|uniref:uncharacterized protein n=1 Tax=Phomopsis amygdali TaxID=1214568 RepID=UPI0022FF3C01|nr:uncharacterized protein J7T55_014738 [Diaporthe amygdali]KAJ0109936.1 hypothetical protein J7T55_014738 [Diaporthe amygdali]
MRPLRHYNADADEALRLAASQDGYPLRQNQRLVVSTSRETANIPSTHPQIGSNNSSMGPSDVSLNPPQGPAHEGLIMPRDFANAQGSFVASGRGHGHADAAQPQPGFQASSNPIANELPVPQQANAQDQNAAEASNGSSKEDRVAPRKAEMRVLLNQRGSQYSGKIRSLEDLKDFEEVQKLVHLTRVRDLSAGFPLTEAEYMKHSRELFDAMKDLVDIHDKVGNTAATVESDGDSLAVKFVKSKSPIEVEIMAGKMMRAMLKAQRGQLHLPRFKFQYYSNFTLRFRAVVAAVQFCKLLVRSAFDSDEWVERIVANPKVEMDQKIKNKYINDGRSLRTRTTLAALSAGTGQGQPSQGPAAPPAQNQAAPGAAPAERPSERPSKRAKPSQEQPAQPEVALPSSAEEINTPQDQQPMDRVLPAVSSENFQQLMDECTSLDELSMFPSVMSPYAFPGGGDGTYGFDGNMYAASAQMLPPYTSQPQVPEPIEWYGFETYVQPTGGAAGMEATELNQDKPQDEDQEEKEHDDPTHHNA